MLFFMNSLLCFALFPAFLIWHHQSAFGVTDEIPEALNAFRRNTHCFHFSHWYIYMYSAVSIYVSWSKNNRNTGYINKSRLFFKQRIGNIMLLNCYYYISLYLDVTHDPSIWCSACIACTFCERTPRPHAVLRSGILMTYCSILEKQCFLTL